MKEDAFQRQVITLASLYQWRFFHPAPGFARGHWATQYLASGPGFPDLVLVGDGVIFAELKSDKGMITRPQKEWGHSLILAGAEYYLWRPSDLERITERLSRWKPSRLSSTYV